MKKSTSSKALLIREVTEVTLSKSDIISYLRLMTCLPASAKCITVTATGDRDDDDDIVKVQYVVETNRED